MKIKETIERECCEPKDMKKYRGAFQPFVPQLKDASFCIHCGNLFVKESFTDAAGGSDWTYALLPLEDLFAPDEPVKPQQCKCGLCNTQHCE